ncbi:MAG: hypothetical protein WEE89_07265 [Gemmatimonadota bacterium]
MRFGSWTLTMLCVAGTGSAQDSGTLRRIQLEVPTTIDGILCAPTKKPTTFLYASGGLESCALASDADFFGHNLPAGSWVTLTELGRPRHVWLSRDTWLQGHRCKGTGRGGWSTAFYPSGRLELCFLATEEVIAGVPCRKGNFWGEITGGVSVIFYESGQLRECGAARGFTLTGRRYRSHERVMLDVDGKPRMEPVAGLARHHAGSSL